jgi:hypothetical protein
MHVHVYCLSEHESGGTKQKLKNQQAYNIVSGYFHANTPAGMMGV